MVAGSQTANLVEGKSDRTRLSEFLAARDWLVALVAIVVLELVCFGAIIRQVGFYLDDWSTLKMLTDAPKQLFEASFWFLLRDPKIIGRPAQAFYLVAEYFLLGHKPLAYHLLNCLWEVLASFFLYLGMARLTGKKSLALLAALILIVYPNHDCTHYWCLCSAQTLSLACFFASFYSTLRAAENGSKLHLALSIFWFSISIFCYETFLPLLVLNVGGALLVLHEKKSWSASFKSLPVLILPFLAPIALMVFYSRMIAPKLGRMLIHRVHVSAVDIMNEIWTGTHINLPDIALPFFVPLAVTGLEYWMSPLPILGLVLAIAIIVASLKFLLALDKPGTPLRYILALGVITFVASYTIFGLNDEYVPILSTILNRVNYGAAVAIAIIFACVISFVAGIAKDSHSNASQMRRLTIAASCLVPLLLFCIFANRGMAQSWILSWETQKVIAATIKKVAPRLKAGDAIILANCPRYVMWSPLFDGIWDFQPMLRLTLGNDTIKGGVVSERLRVTQTGLEDLAKGAVCARYDFNHIYIVVPPSFDVIPVNSAQQFIDLIKERGFGFDLDRSVIGKWQHELADSSPKRE